MADAVARIPKEKQLPIPAVMRAAIAAGMMIPDEAHIPSAAFLAPQIFGMYYLAKSLQGPAVEAHQREGGALASAWGAAGIGILTALVVLGALFGVLLVTSLTLDA